MAKRGGYATNSDLFAKRGDPWITRREGIKDFGRNPEAEDPEYDFDHRFHQSGGFGPKIAEPRTEARAPVVDYDKEIADAQRRKASIGRRMQGSINRRHANFIEVDKSPIAFRTCVGCKSAKCVHDNLCHGALR